MDLKNLIISVSAAYATSYFFSGYMMWRFDETLYVDLADLGYKIKKDKLSDIYHLISNTDKGKVDPLLLPITNIIFSSLVMNNYASLKQTENLDLVIYFLKENNCIMPFTPEELKEYDKNPTYHTALRISKRKNSKKKITNVVIEDLTERVKRRFISHTEEEKETSITYLEEEDRIVVLYIDGYINELDFEQKLSEIKRLLKIYIPILNINKHPDNLEIMFKNQDGKEVYFTTLNKEDFKIDYYEPHVNYIKEEDLLENTLKYQRRLI